MDSQPKHSRLMRASRPVAAALAVAALTGWSGLLPAQTTTLTLANPDWNITLSDYGYSDFVLDNTPGFQGREYLCGEWATAVSYEIAGGGTVNPQWLEPSFSYPDWTTNSTFHVVSPITQGVANADNLPTARSVVSNGQLEITLHHEMLDTVTGTPMGSVPASSGGTGGFISSNRYVLKETYTIKNVSGAAISKLQLFQLLHGLQSQRGTYDDRSYAGPLSAFRHDVTQGGVDSWAVGSGSSTAGLEDFIGFHAATAPSGYEVGYFGIEGNGIDNHSIGKPSDGVHLSIENNWQGTPYSSRLGTDSFAPPQRWVAGAERWDLGNLAAGASVGHEVLLSLRTGTRVTSGSASSGGCNGGSSVPGGLDYQFETVTSEGSCFGEFARSSEAELAVRVAAGEFSPITFPIPGSPAQVWHVGFSGTYSGPVSLAFAYDPTVLPAGIDEGTLAIHHFSGGAWQAVPGVVNQAAHTISCATDTLGSFALGVEGGAMFQIAASESPSNSGVVVGAGAYAKASGVTLVASAKAGYAFVNWTEGATVVSGSPSYTFAAEGDRALAANFVPVGDAQAISTGSSPASGGSTSGDGAYAAGSSATVVATSNPGYKFSKWTENGTRVPGAGSSYTFTVTGDRSLVAAFIPVYTVTAISDPAGDFEVQPDSPLYEPGEKVVMEVNHVANGYSFVNWTENGLPVSKLPDFTFSCNGNRNLVAHFALGHRIDLSASPKTAGVVSGDGVYPDGAAVTVTAEAKWGYVFKNWTLNGTEVGTLPSHSFPSTVDQTLVANFVAWRPVLNNLRLTPDTLVLSWPAGASGWVLQESQDLSPASWVDSTRPVNVVGSENQVLVSPLIGDGFFRLAHP